MIIRRNLSSTAQGASNDKEWRRICFAAELGVHDACFAELAVSALFCISGLSDVPIHEAQLLAMRLKRSCSLTSTVVASQPSDIEEIVTIHFDFAVSDNGAIGAAAVGLPVCAFARASAMILTTSAGIGSA